LQEESFQFGKGTRKHALRCAAGPFKLTGIPDIIFGEGTLSTLPDALGKYGNSALLVLGSRSFQASAHREKLQAELDAKGISYLVTNMGSEPTTGMIDGAAAQYREAEIDVLVSIGGGSVIDAGKALSAMLTVEDSVVNYLEGVDHGRDRQRSNKERRDLPAGHRRVQEIPAA
jgi:alcohol dehydrogenase class IV